MMFLGIILFLLCATCTCAIDNLALGRPAWQEYNFPMKPVQWGANKSVDGLYSDRSAGGNQCTISGDGKRTATLRVDLGNTVSISYINIFYRTDNVPSPGAFFQRFAGFSLYVSNTTSKADGKLCFHELQIVSGTPVEDQRINCSMYGQYVIYYNERKQGADYPSYYSTYAYNEICEWEVYGCPDPGYYGENCDQSCSENCRGQQCDAVTGNCVNGCKPGYQGPHCSYSNLALRRPTWQQHNWPDKPVVWGAAKAVDGKYSDRSAGGNQCTISGPNKQTAEWRVDLQKVVSISHINIYYRTDNVASPGAYYSRFAGFYLYVSNTTSKEDGHLCFHEIQYVNGTPLENQTISCPVHGRYVIYYNERKQGVTYPSYYSTYAYNDLCELEVYGCPDSVYYGEYCDLPCSQNCQGQRCSITTGECLGCIPGYRGPLCSQECDGGLYGVNCNQTCGHCINDSHCHHINGTCLDGCSFGYEGSLCINECRLGFYGKDCIHECGDNCGVTKRCNRFTGECEGRCKPGWKGIRCDKKCDGGMYGVNCNQTCGHCINDSQCHHIDGTCMDGCSSGYVEPLCVNECDGGLYGVNCNQTCGHCINDSNCHHINGTCLHGCSPGFVEPLCLNVCSRSYWGVNCKGTCSTECVNQTCHHESGVCRMYVKPLRMCDSCTCNYDYTITIISIVVSVIIVFTGSVLNYLIWRRNQHKDKDFSASRQTDVSKKLSTVDTADPQSFGDKITSPYAELGALDHPDTYDELHRYAKADDKM